METVGWRRSRSWHGNWKLEGLIGVNVDITHLHGVGLPPMQAHTGFRSEREKRDIEGETHTDTEISRADCEILQLNHFKSSKQSRGGVFDISVT